ncbi:MAG: PorV/PorQ family protein, partial [candidate division KSB1 bacterium]|nr:PorV/PorQ family protein [candidate division KSB1 bacterium]
PNLSIGQDGILPYSSLPKSKALGIKYLSEENKMSKTILQILTTCIVVSISFGNGKATGLVAAKYAGEFITLGVGAQALGMGGAFVAVANDVTAGYWNPAGLLSIEHPQLILMHADCFAGIVKYDYGSLALPFGKKRCLAVSLIRLGVDDIHVTELIDPSKPVGAEIIDDNGRIVRNTPYILKTISDAEYAFYLTYSRRKTDTFSYGGNIKLIRKGVGDNSAWGIGFDLGVLFNPVANLRVGANFQDMTSTLLAWNTDTGRKELILPTLKTGVAYPFTINFPFGSGFGKVTPAFDVDIRFENRRSAAQSHLGRVSFDFHAGLEFWYLNVLALRIGSADVGKFSAGAGIKLPQLNLDYAFMSHNELGDTHRISLKVSIEKARLKK